MAAATPALEESSGSSGTSSEAKKVGTVVSGTMPVTSKPPVTQQDFVDALTAVMTGKVAFSDDDNQDDDDDDDHSLSSDLPLGAGLNLVHPRKTRMISRNVLIVVSESVNYSFTLNRIHLQPSNCFHPIQKMLLL
jgi:hypothetical protein